MKEKQENERAVYAAVTRGELSIDKEGRIWRHVKRTWNRWTGETRSTSLHPPKRAENDIGQYLQVRVMVSRKRYHALAHRVVFIHFKGAIPPGLTVNHENGLKKDNGPDNLTLATHAEQVKHAREVLKVGRLDQNGEKNAMAKLNEAAVREIRRRRKAGDSLKSIGAAFDISDKTVSKIARGDRWAFLGA